MDIPAKAAKSARATEYTETQAPLAADFLARARSISSLVERDAEMAEQNSMITKAVHDAFVAHDLYWMLLPKDLGGADLGGRGGFEVIEEIARADGSTGWSLMANSFNNALACAYLPDAGAEIIWGGTNRGIACGQFAPAGKAVMAEGGLLGGGYCQFGSGCGHANWIGGGVILQENGSPLLLDGGLPETRVIHVPIDKAEICGNWDVTGLVATASFDYEIPEQFVPDALVFPGSVETKPVRGGPLLELGWFGIGAVGHSAVVLGITKRALEEVVAIVHKKRRLGYTCFVHEDPVFKNQFTLQEGTYWAGRHLILGAIDTVEEAIASGEGVTAEHLARIRQACSWVHKAAVEVVGFCHHWGASQAFRNPSALGRCTRDLAVATQHVIADEAALVDSADPIYSAWLDQGVRAQ